MPICYENHRYDQVLSNLPIDQGGQGRHKCTGCAYQRGFNSGVNFEENINIDLDSLDESQAGTGRHKSPHAAFAQGYLDGITSVYK
jgi:hypothetical protein